MILQLQHATLDFLEDTISRGRQSWTRQTTVSWSGFKLRTTVHRDSYDFQSKLYVEVFDPRGLRWNVVQALSGTDHGDLPSYVVKDDNAIYAATEPVVERMLAYAQHVLDGATA